MEYDRLRYYIVGDGNCLFRSLSFIIFGKQEKHFEVRTFLVQFISMNPSYFKTYCLPLTVQDHVKQMENNFVWGTHAEIFAVSLYFTKPVYVALYKDKDGNGPYYWAKYMCREGINQLHFTSETMKLPNQLKHLELCHVNGNHYEVVLNTNKTLPLSPPYTGDSSCSINLTSDAK